MRGRPRWLPSVEEIKVCSLRFMICSILRQDSIGKLSWTDLAVRASVSSIEQFEECLTEQRHTGVVERDVLLARELNVERTPTFIIGDEAYSGLPPASWFKRQIARAQRTGR